MAKDLAVKDKALWEIPKCVRGNYGIEAYVRNTVCGFLDTATTSFGRATHYNTREEQQRAELAAHAEMFGFDRSLYTLFLMLPGTTDRSSQIGIKTLLSSPRKKADDKGLVNSELEQKAIARLVSEMRPDRVMKMFQAFRLGDEKLGIKKANNARTRKLILRTILGSPSLELWAVKYRDKLRAALIHAWGERTASIIEAIINKHPSLWGADETRLLNRNLVKYISESGVDRAFQCISFVLGNAYRPGGKSRIDFTAEPIRSFFKARKSISSGKRLPPEVLEGIRSTYHRDIPKEKVIELTSKSMTKTQRLQTQKRAKAAGVEVKMDPKDYDPVRLYIYAFENGLTEEIEDALLDKVRKAARAFPAEYERVGIIVDASRSMAGDETQKLRPLAATLAMRDMLKYTATGYTIVGYCGGVFNDTDEPARAVLMPKPARSTALAERLLELIKSDLDVVFVLSDGYENSPAGRTHEVIAKLRQIGNTTPIYHINPVFAAEVGSVKELAPKLAPTLPVGDPKALSTTFIRGMIEAEPVEGINALIGTVRPLLEGNQRRL